MTSLSRPSRILGAALLLAGLMIGAVLAQGQAVPRPLAPARGETVGRYRSIVVVANPGDARLIITDTVTGMSWHRGFADRPNQWKNLGTPVEAE